jgi:YegS C-terminal NAD kinase beta sandwich-like domain
VTIEKGQAWGRPARELDAGPPVEVHTDAEARVVAERARRANDPVPPLLLLGGDLARTVGGTGDATHATGPGALALPCDLGSVLLDGRQHWFVAHLVARRSWWRGRAFVAMNAQFLGDWNVAPRSHPNDGRLDVLDVAASMRVTERLQARRRLPTGTHLPHPAIAVTRVSAVQETFDPPLPVWLDGTALGAVRNISLRVEPDALTVVI